MPRFAKRVSGNLAKRPVSTKLRVPAPAIFALCQHGTRPKPDVNSSKIVIFLRCLNFLSSSRNRIVAHCALPAGYRRKCRRGLAHHCLLFGVRCDIIEPCGFAFSDRALKRAGMDYAAQAEIRRHADWPSFLDTLNGARLVLMSSKASTPLPQFHFRSDDVILMGSESSGAPAQVHDRADARVYHSDGSRISVLEHFGIGWHRLGRRSKTDPAIPGSATLTLTLDTRQQAARGWFEALRDRICAAFRGQSKARQAPTHRSNICLGTGWTMTARPAAAGCAG